MDQFYRLTVIRAEEANSTDSWNQRQNVRIELEGFEDTVDFGILDGVSSAI